MTRFPTSGHRVQVKADRHADVLRSTTPANPAVRAPGYTPASSSLEVSRICFQPAASAVRQLDSICNTRLAKKFRDCSRKFSQEG